MAESFREYPLRTQVGPSLSAAMVRLASSCLQTVHGSKFSVLIFHRVLPEPDVLNPATPDASRFEQLMMRLARDFQVVPLSQAIHQALEQRLPPRSVAITFDDGYADNATIAAPILRRLGLTGTFFVATGFLDGGRMWNDTVIETARSWDGDTMDLSSLGLGVYAMASATDRIAAVEAVIRQTKYLDPAQRNEIVSNMAGCLKAALPDNLMMTIAQVRGLVEQGMEVGAHTVNHPILASLPDDQAQREIGQSKAELEAILEAPVNLFAYPNGKPSLDYTRAHVDMVKRAGFTGAVSTAFGAPARNLDPFQVPRFTPWGPTLTKFMLQLAQNFSRTRYPVA